MINSILLDKLTSGEIKMPTQPSQATAEGMPKIQMTRRSLLAGAAGIMVASATMTSTSMAETSVTELERLIEQHKLALQATSAAWDEVSLIDDGADWSELCDIRVQVGTLLAGWDTEGNQILRPIYAYSDREVDNHVNRTLQSSINLARSDAAKAKTAELYEEKKAEFKSVLRDCYARRKLVEDEVGLTSAKDEAIRCSNIAVAIEDEIIDRVPVNLAEAALKAQFIISQHDDAFF